MLKQNPNWQKKNSVGAKVMIYIVSLINNAKCDEYGAFKLSFE